MEEIRSKIFFHVLVRKSRQLMECSGDMKLWCLVVYQEQKTKAVRRQKEFISNVENQASVSLHSAE